MWEVGLGEDLYLLTKPGWTVELRRKWGPRGGEGGLRFSFSLCFQIIPDNNNNNDNDTSPCTFTTFPACHWELSQWPQGERQGSVFTLGNWNLEKRGNQLQLQPHKAGLRGGDLPLGLPYELKSFPENSYGPGIVEVECSTNIC